MSREEAERLDRMALFIQSEWENLNRKINPFQVVITPEMAHLMTMVDILEYIFFGKRTETRTINNYNDIPSRLLMLSKLVAEIISPDERPAVASSDRIIDLQM